MVTLGRTPVLSRAEPVAALASRSLFHGLNIMVKINLAVIEMISAFFPGIRIIPRSTAPMTTPGGRV
jgi:hypothetical protein